MKIESIIDVLSENMLFRRLSSSRISELLSICSYGILEVNGETLISSESEPCKNIGFVLDGKVSNYKTNPSGNHVVVKTMYRGEYFGEALVFSSSQDCPSTIIAGKNSVVLLISAEDILKICELEPIFLKNLLVSLSDKVFMLNKKIKLLSYTSVRQRLASFLTDESRKRGSRKFRLDKTRDELGEFIGVTRPSVSRELSKMVSDGLISVDGKLVELLDMESLLELL